MGLTLLFPHLVGREGRAKALGPRLLRQLCDGEGATQLFERRDDEASVVACTRRACGCPMV